MGIFFRNGLWKTEVTIDEQAIFFQGSPSFSWLLFGATSPRKQPLGSIERLSYAAGCLFPYVNYTVLNIPEIGVKTLRKTQLHPRYFIFYDRELPGGSPSARIWSEVVGKRERGSFLKSNHWFQKTASTKDHREELASVQKPKLPWGFLKIQGAVSQLKSMQKEKLGAPGPPYPVTAAPLWPQVSKRA